MSTISFTHYRIMSLFLQFELHSIWGAPLQLSSEILSQKSHRIQLICGDPHSHPNQMHVIGHQNIGGTVQSFAHGCVQKQFPEMRMKQIIQPTL